MGRHWHKALFTNLCCALIVESLNGDQLYLDHYYLISSFSWLHITLVTRVMIFSTNQLWSCAFVFCSYESWSWNSKSWSWSWSWTSESWQQVWLVPGFIGSLRSPWKSLKTQQVQNNVGVTLTASVVWNCGMVFDLHQWMLRVRLSMIINIPVSYSS